MASLGTILVGIGIALIGLYIIGKARTYYDRYRTITEITSAPSGKQEPGKETTIRGPIRVTEPASPERTPPDGIADSAGSPALWGWRIREYTMAGEGADNWKTVEGGVAVGDFTIQQEWDHVHVDRTGLREKLDATEDPFEVSNLYLGEPDEDIPLGELTFLNKLYERFGISMGSGNDTTAPDRYQATIVRDGDDLVVRGKLIETEDGLFLRETSETPLVVATGDFEKQGKQLRSRARWRVAYGFALILLGGVATVSGLL